nr:ankyrin repeat-containing protein NPR4-like [Ziziphus jujuba var. spinosa]
MDPKLYDTAINGSHDFSAMIDAAATANLSGRRGGHGLSKTGKLEVAGDDQPHVVGFLYEKNEKGNTALHVAAKFGHLEFVRILIRASKAADVEGERKLLTMVNEQRETALHEAIRHNHLDIVKLLIDEEPELVSLTNHEGEFALFMAVDRCFYPVALPILEKNNCSFDGRNGMNVFACGCCRRISTFKEDLSLFFRNLYRIHKLNRQPLLSRLPKPKSDDDFGWTPLHYAAHYGNTKLVELFLKQDDNINRTALHVAVESREAEVVKFFLQSLTFLDLINEKDNEGNTALHLAAASARADFKILVMLANDSKIDKEATNNDGMTFYDIVLSNKQIKDIEIFEVGTGLPSLEQKFIREETKEAEINNVNDEAEIDGQVDEEEGKEEPNGEGVQKRHVASRNEKHNPQLKQADNDAAMINLTIATFIVTATFTAAFQLPGGNDEDGLAVSSGRADFRLFLFFDTVAFVCSTASMLIHFFVPVLGSLAVPLYPGTLLTGTSLVLMVIAFDRGIRAIFPEDSDRTIFLEHSDRNPFPILPMFVAIFIVVMVTSMIIFSMPRIFRKKLPRINARSRFGLWSG